MQETILALLDSHSFLAFFGAFGAGSITAIAPCSLVSVPLLVASSLAVNKDLSGKKRVLYTYLFAGLFALGVAISFSIMGYIVAKFGGFFSIAPIWAYLSAGVLSIFVGLYAWGIFGEINKSSLLQKLIKFRLWGAMLIGIVFGLVSTPCASAPLIAIVTVAANSGYVYAYALILTFALGHSLLLLAAGISVGFAQSITVNNTLSKFSNILNRSFALLLIGFGIYFITMAYQQF